MAQIVRKPQSVLDLGPVDISAILPLVSRMSDKAWQAEDEIKENNFSCFHHTKHVIFRFTPQNRDPWEHYANPAWTVWQHVLLPVMQAAIVPYGFREPLFSKAMFARLEAGEKIDRHRDGAGSNLRTHKIHVPLITNPGAMFESAGEQHHLELGRAYEVNNIALHAVENHGDEDRIHFIFEVFEGDQAREEVAAAE